VAGVLLLVQQLCLFVFATVSVVVLLASPLLMLVGLVVFVRFVVCCLLYLCFLSLLCLTPINVLRKIYKAIVYCTMVL